MISDLIVISSLVFAGVYLFFWLRQKDLRRQIENPKHHFQHLVQAYDELCVKEQKEKDNAHAHE